MSVTCQKQHHSTQNIVETFALNCKSKLLFYGNSIVLAGELLKVIDTLPFMIKKINEVFLVIIFAMALLVFPSGIQYKIGQNNSGTIPKHFVVQKVVYAFDGGVFLCSFNATSGSVVSISLSTTGDDSYQTIFRVISNNHGTVFNSLIGGNREVTNFNQTVTLNYDESYNVSVAKHPFYTTVKINGVIGLHIKESTNATNAPTYSHSPTISEYPALIMPSVFLIITSLSYSNRTKKKEGS